MGSIPDNPAFGLMRGVHGSAFDLHVPPRKPGEESLAFVRRILRENGINVPDDPVAFPTTTLRQRLAPARTIEQRIDAIFKPPDEPGGDE